MDAVLAVDSLGEVGLVVGLRLVFATAPTTHGLHINCAFQHGDKYMKVGWERVRAVRH